MAIATLGLSVVTVWLLPDRATSVGPRVGAALLATAFLLGAFGLRHTIAAKYQVAVVAAGVGLVIAAFVPSLVWLRVGSAGVGAIALVVGTVELKN